MQIKNHQDVLVIKEGVEEAMKGTGKTSLYLYCRGL
jgi:hypothetical protein